jgi:hypothetical protein
MSNQPSISIATGRVCPTCSAVDSIVDGRCTAFGTGCGYVVPDVEQPIELDLCEVSTPSRDFDGTAISFDCIEAATHVIAYVDSTLAGSGFENVELHVCDSHEHELFPQIDSDDAMHSVKSEPLR